MIENDIRTDAPVPTRFGATVHDGGVHFAIFSRHATRVWLALFDRPGQGAPTRELELDAETHRWGDVWSVFIEGVGPGQFYLYRMDGPYAPSEGHRFDPDQYLLDPYAKAITGHYPWKARSALKKPPWPSELGLRPKCIVVDDWFDWEGDRPLQRPLEETIIYETHVRSLTAHPSADVAHPGTYRGLIETIPYLKTLGITAVELLPVHEFNELELDRHDPHTGQRLVNLWGYSTIGFFAPMGRYCADGNRGEQVGAFKQMVRALHAAGIEVILDVVFNHTAEGGADGPTISFRGIDNPIYYLLDDERRGYKNYSGCGNTMNCNHPVVRDLILECLYYWVLEMHVDGFRFDLASILGRNEKGELMENPPLLEHIAQDPFLRDTKLIAEAWDLGGAYQVGSFPGGRWSEWNGRFRDDVRRFWAGEIGVVPDLASRLCGSADLYHASGRSPRHSINFITSHDGFTLNDLVSYEHKHNRMNAEGDRDGTDHNLSRNYGVEGPTDDRAIERIRRQQIKNYLATLFLSHGVPMLLGGDEFRRTQKGNNNAYCQDNEVSWYDWSLLETHHDLLRFTRELIAFRRRHPIFSRTRFFTGEDTNHNTVLDITWFGPNGERPRWSDPTLRVLGCLIDGAASEIGHQRDDNDLLILFNAQAKPFEFHIPAAPHGRVWHVAVDTAAESPFDIYRPHDEPRIDRQIIYPLKPRSTVVLLSSEPRS